jgi:hypothetical protein
MTLAKLAEMPRVGLFLQYYLTQGIEVWDIVDIDVLAMV